MKRIFSILFISSLFTILIQFLFTFLKKDSFPLSVDEGEVVEEEMNHNIIELLNITDE